MNRAPKLLLLHGKNFSGKDTVADKAVTLGATKGILVAYIPPGTILRKIATGEMGSVYSKIYARRKINSLVTNQLLPRMR